MLRFLADENFNNDILRGVLRASPEIDILRVQDAGLRGADDEKVLDFAAEENRILLTHDVKTITRFAYERIENNLKMPGVFEVKRTIAFSNAIEDILLLAECSVENEWEGQIIYLPLK